MMKVELSNDLVRIVVLDISGVYATIYDEATLPPSDIDGYISKYQDSKYKVIII